MQETGLQFVTLEQTQKLKAAGFDWDVNVSYHSHHKSGYCKMPIVHDNVLLRAYNDAHNWNEATLSNGRFCLSAPSVALALKWFRDVKKFHYTIEDMLCVDGTAEGFVSRRAFITKPIELIPDDTECCLGNWEEEQVVDITTGSENYEAV